MRETGKIGFIGITTEEPWTVTPFLYQNDINVYQIAYNFIYQAAARHFLIDAAKANVGVVTMRTMTSGILPLAARYLAPEWQAAHDLCIVPVGARQLVQVAMVTCLPALPLMFLVLPFMEVLKILAGVIK